MADAVNLRIPSLKTNRLLLNAPRVEDFEGYASIVTTERGRYIGGPFNREDAWLDFSQMVAGWVLRGFGALSIRSIHEERYLGTVLVHHEFGDPEPELGWLLVENAEGQGFAYEAGVAMKEWAFSQTSLRTLVSYIDPENARAIELAQKLGGVPDRAHAGALCYRYSAGRLC